MRFSCEQQKLSRALNIVSKAVTSRTTMPILKGILLEVTADGKLTLSASDMDISIKNTIDVDVQEAGSIVVMAKLFGDIIRKLPSTDIYMESDSELNITIRCRNSEFKIAGMSPEEFPNIIQIDDNTRKITFHRSFLKTMIDRTAFAASSDEARGIITGMLIEASPDTLNMVAIDGYRMSINHAAFVPDEPFHFVVSAKVITEISRIISEIGDDESTGELFMGDRKVIFRFGDIDAELKLMEGEFIRYKDILPRDSSVELRINRKMLMESIERASLLSRAGKNNLIRMSIQDTVVTITSTSEEGNVKEEIPVVKEGNDLEIGFNSQYVLDILKAVDDEEVLMLLNTPITPCLVRPTEGSSYEYLVLPVRIN